MTRATLTGLVIAQDEERDLPACLETLAFCDERLVIDGGSVDGTAGVAQASGARVVQNPWPGYAAQRRFGLQQSRCDYVLMVDADERVDGPLAAAIQKTLADPARLPGYRVRVENHFLGRELRHGGLGRDLHLRLFRRDLASYPERTVHEGVSVEGPSGQLPGALRHESYGSLSEYLQKSDRYSALAAAERFQRGIRIGTWSVVWRLPWGFFRRYLFWGGFLDGYPGFMHAALSAYSDFLKLAKLRELQNPSRGAP